MNSIESQFIPYSAAVKLKDLGFDWECLRLYDQFEEFNSWSTWAKNSKEDKYNVACPLYSQSFDWFRVEHGLHYSIEYGSTINKYSCDVYKTSDDLIELELNKITGVVEDIYSKDTYESARLACLEKLIELVTEKKR